MNDTPENQESQPTKVCSKCGKEFPATAEFWQRDKNKKYGLSTWCKECSHDYNRTSERKAYMREWQRKYRLTPEYKAYTYEYNRTAKRVEKRRTRQATPEYKAYMREYHQKPKSKEYFRQRQTTVEHKTYQRKYNQKPENKAKARVRARSSKYKAARRSYANTPEGKATKSKNRHVRSARKKTLPSTFTIKEWQNALRHWHGTCAYCGVQQSFWHVLEQEHYIPLSKGGGYTADNIIPACRLCNSSKKNRDPEKWILEKFGKRKGKNILKKIQEYFAVCSKESQ